ncbi:MAG: exodeoxyribonuclease VII large subunit, partial [Ruthenibacterium sp.]
KLENEGLFDLAHKRLLPGTPHCVGLVTSKTGAAIQDIYNVTKRRDPMARFLLCPVTVQGNESAQGIANAIRSLDKSGRCDVIIVARGGGSREDLWVFNSELIARAAYACKTPLVSAIGHEIDFCILDFVADLRAPTPSAAAELVMPDMQSVAENTCKVFMNICKEIQKKLNLCYNKTIECEASLHLTQTALLPQRCLADLHSVQKDIEHCMREKLVRLEQRQRQHASLCASLNPYGVLSRGYSIARRNGTVLKDSRAVCAEDAIEVQLLRGRLSCIVTKTESGELQ